MFHKTRGFMKAYCFSYRIYHTYVLRYVLRFASKKIRDMKTSWPPPIVGKKRDPSPRIHDPVFLVKLWKILKFRDNTLKIPENVQNSEKYYENFTNTPKNPENYSESPEKYSEKLGKILPKKWMPEAKSLFPTIPPPHLNNFFHHFLAVHRQLNRTACPLACPSVRLSGTTNNQILHDTKEWP